MTSLRDLLAVILLLGALVLGGLWLPATWLQHHVVDREGFLSIAEPLGEDAAFQRSLTDGAVEQVLGSDRVPDWAAERLTPLAEDQLAELTGTSTYASMWAEAMGQTHDALFTPGASDVDVDFAPVIDGALSEAEEILPIDLPRPEDATVTVATIPDVPLVHRAGVLDPWGQRLGPVALVMAVLAVVIAAHRRTMTLLAGLSALGAGGIALLIATRIAEIVPDSVDQAAFLGPIVQVFEQRLTTDVTGQGIILMGAGALVAAVGLALMGLHRRPVV